MNIVYHHRTRGLGAEGTHVKAIVDALRLKGHVVRILSFPGTYPEKMSVLDTSRNHALKRWHDSLMQWIAGLTKKVPNFVFEIFEILYNLMIPMRLNGAIKEFKPELIYERYSLFMFAGVWLARIYTIPIILEVNDSALVSRIRPVYFKYFAEAIEKWVFTKCTGMVFISACFRDLAVTKYGAISKTVICPNAAELSKFDPSKYDKEIVKNTLGLDGKVVCGYSGGFAEWHGIVWFVQKLIPKMRLNPTYGLLMVGDGATFDEVSEIVRKEGMESQIILTGQVKHDEIPRFLAGMDFGVLPDLNVYCSPIKLFESMAMAQGMVLPGSAPVKEVVVDDVTSWLFPVNDQDACIDKVMMVFGDSTHRSQVGKNARVYIERERQWTHNVELTLTLLEN